MLPNAGSVATIGWYLYHQLLFAERFYKLTNLDCLENHNPEPSWLSL